MKRAEATAAARRVGPLLAVDASGDPVLGEDFVGGGELLVRVDDGDFEAGNGSAVLELGYGWYAYQATQAEATSYAIAITIDDVCEKFTLLENVEATPQGIVVATTNANARRMRGLRAFDASENIVLADDIVAEVSINGAPWSAAAGTVVGDSGYPYYDPTDAEVATRGWVALRLSTAGGEELCVVRYDIVAAPSSSGSSGGGVTGSSGGQLAKIIAKTLGPQTIIGFGPMTLVRVEPGTRVSPLTAAPAPTETSYACKGRQGIKANGYREPQARSTSVAFTILGATLASGIMPRAGDKIIHGGTTYTIAADGASNPDGVGAVWECMTRKGGG